MNDPQPPSLPKSLHPQTLGKNKFANPPQKKEKATVTAQPAAPNTPVSAPLASPATATAPIRAPAPVAPSPAPTTPKSAASPPSLPGKDLKRFEITVSINGSSEPPFVVDVPLTGNGPADQAAARALAKKKFPGRAMTVISSRIFTRTENCLLEIAPGSTLSALFGAPGGTTEDLVEIGNVFYDGSRGMLFLRNLRSHIGLAFRPSLGGLVLFSNRIVGNRLASELPMIVAEILGNNAREIQIYLKS